MTNQIESVLFIEAGFKVVSGAYKTLSTYSKCGLNRIIEKIIDVNKEEANQPILVDKIVEENAFVELVNSPLGKEIEEIYNVPNGEWIYGEESLGSDPDLSQVKYPIAMLDMLDGSDLFKRNLSNWCSAIMFYQPDSGEIIASFVCDSSGNIYYASKFENGAYITKPEHTQTKINVSPMMYRKKEPTLENASLAFYGQKKNSLYEVVSKKNLLDSLDSGKGGRIYNLGGNPMLIKVADGSIDIVLSIGKGQKVYDVLPGLYIAIKAGAVALTPEGEELTFESEHIKKALQKPANDTFRIRYVLATNRNLANEVIEKLRN